MIFCYFSVSPWGHPDTFYQPLSLSLLEMSIDSIETMVLESYYANLDPVKDILYLAPPSLIWIIYCECAGKLATTLQLCHMSFLMSQIIGN